MSDADAEFHQPKATTKEGARVEAAAIFLLRHIIAWSVKEQKEYGGVIYLDTASGEIRANGPLSATTSANTVYVGQNEVNLGLPATQRPLAWYHTHPLTEMNGWHFEWDKFEGGDYRLSTTRRIPGYVCTMDGWIWRFDPSPEPQADPETGHIDDDGPGSWGKILNVPRAPVDSAHAREYKQPAGLHW
ncbi:DUF4329 domain-containing protein [Neoroseomonas lacus]|uniref:DUF4329 domain-containing protein n=1 Tax=Neoroseomonas lacus TaxID=287609 RepID=A0A917KDD0_9PROT|nr:DUF4329 domain-containing protein [Neoroseomonas lacus]GGJ10085.1 hypothetical protein GCM10011320_16440 [Neoroseomonas lacus]